MWMKNYAFQYAETGYLRKQEQGSKSKDKLMLEIDFSAQENNPARSWKFVNAVIGAI